MFSRKEPEVFIVNGVEVNFFEKQILTVLVQQEQPLKVFTLSEKLKNAYSDAALYSALNKLNQKKLVVLQNTICEIMGSQVRQQYWSVLEEVKEAITGDKKSSPSVCDVTEK